VAVGLPVEIVLEPANGLVVLDPVVLDPVKDDLAVKDDLVEDLPANVEVVEVDSAAVAVAAVADSATSTTLRQSWPEENSTSLRRKAKSSSCQRHRIWNYSRPIRFLMTPGSAALQRSAMVTCFSVLAASFTV
jgi:hypothetical protein